MTNWIVLAALVVLLSPWVAAEPGKTRILCAYSGQPEEAFDETIDPADRPAVAALRDVAARVHDLLQLRPSFEIAMTGVPEAVAQVNVLDEKRFIQFDRTHFRRLLEDEPTRRAAQTILAHEIGHLLQGHGMNPTRQKAQELEADEFSGGVMYRLGASLVEAQRAARMYTRHPAPEGRPSPEERLLAIRRGWRAARAIGDHAQRQRDYSAAMTTAARAIEKHDTIRANRTLERLLPRPGSQDVRSFGWFHYWHLLHAEEQIIAVPSKGNQPWSVRCIEPIPNTTLVAVGGTIEAMQGAIFIYDFAVTPPKVVDQWSSGTGLLGVAPDGSWIAYDELRTLPDRAEYGLTLRSPTRGTPVRFDDVHRIHIESFAVSPDGRYVATGDGVGMVRLWDVTTRRSLSHFPHGEAAVSALAFSADGSTLLSGGRDDRLVVSAVPALSQIAEHALNLGRIEVLAVSPVGTRFAASGDEGVALFDGMEDVSTPHRFSDDVASALRFSANGKLFATGDMNGVATLYEAADTRAPLRELRGHVGPVHSLAFFAGGKMLLTGDHGSPQAFGGSPLIDAAVRAFRWETAATVVRSRMPVEQFWRPGAVDANVVSPDGALLATTAHGSLGVWARDGSSRNYAIGEVVTAIEFSPDSKRIAASSCARANSADTTRFSNCRTEVWLTGSDAAPLRLEDHQEPVRGIAFGKSVIATAGCDRIRTWRFGPDSSHVEVLADIEITDRCPDPDLGIALTPDDDRIAAVFSSNRNVLWWNAADGTALPAFPLPGGRGASEIAISPNGAWLATGNENSEVTLWSLKRERAPVTLPGDDDGVARALAFTSDGNLLATAAGEREPILLWETAIGVRVGELEPPDTYVANLTFGNDGTLYAAGLAAEQIAWRASTHGEVLESLRQRFHWSRGARERELLVSGLWASSLNARLGVSTRQAMLREAFHLLEEAPEAERTEEELVGWREEILYALRDLAGEP